MLRLFLGSETSQKTVAANQSLYESRRSRGPMKGNHYVSVWFCPMDISRYSFALTYGSGVCIFNEFSNDPYLSGSYETVEQALAAGIREVENDAR